MYRTSSYKDYKDDVINGLYRSNIIYKAIILSNANVINLINLYWMQFNFFFKSFLV